MSLSAARLEIPDMISVIPNMRLVIDAKVSSTLPCGFIQEGVAMQSEVLRSRIVRVFVRLRREALACLRLIGLRVREHSRRCGAKPKT